MIYKEDIIQFIKSIVTGLDLTLTIDSVTDNLDGTFDILMCDTGHLQPLFDITIGGNTYTIIDFISGGIKVSGTQAITATSFVQYTPYFFHGTVRATQAELANIIDANSKTPMVYFYEVISERFIEDNDNILERESKIRLFFLTQADFTNWQTIDYHENAIQPMRRLMERFIDKLKAHPRVQEITDYTVINQNKFGVFINDKGFEKAIFAENLSGCELNIDLEILKTDACDC